MTLGLIWHLLFWSAAMLVVWTYAGYAASLSWLARTTTRGSIVPHQGGNGPHSVSVVVAVRNDAVRLEKKIQQLLALGSPSPLEFIIVCDHCTDDTPDVAARYAARGVKVIAHLTQPAGKAGALNAGVKVATGDLILFNDVRQSLPSGAIEKLAAWFDDSKTGAVSGCLEIASSASGAGSGIDTYWSLEKRIRHWESEIDSSIGCTGAIYMIRRALYEPIPTDTLVDDVVIPMSIAVRGHRVRFDPEAKAFDPQQLTQENEARRKTRTLAGNFQMLVRYPQWMLPWRNRLWWQLISHKYLRILTPALLVVALATAITLAHIAFYRLMLTAALLIMGLALIGLILPRLKSRITSLPAAFLLLQIFVVRGFLLWLKIVARGHQGWK